jgi:hypothetical protein
LVRELEFQHIWQHTFLATGAYKTTGGDTVEILDKGQLNSYGGPDFTDARIRLAGIVWYGSIELHLHSNHWYQHGHHRDPAYNNVVLHVVLKAGKPVFNAAGQPVPTLVFPESALKAQKREVQQGTFILEQEGLRRLHQMENAFGRLHRQCRNDWEQALFVFTGMALGRPQNDQPFHQMLCGVNHRQLLRQSSVVRQQLLMQASGLFPNNQGTPASNLNWVTGKLRPAQHPRMRILQFCNLTHHWFEYRSLVCNPQTTALAMLAFIKATLPTGNDSALKVLINAIVPARSWWFSQQGNALAAEESRRWLMDLPAEKNTHTAGLGLQNAMQSQGVIARVKREIV